MPDNTPPDLALDERLAQLGRAWFADARRQSAAEAKAARASVRAPEDADAVSSGLVDWLFGDAGDGPDGDGPDGGE